MMNLILTHLDLILAFLAGGAVEYCLPKAIARLKVLHPGRTISQDLEAKIVSIVEAKLAEAANSNSNKA